jgi:hypothetical protein
MRPRPALWTTPEQVACEERGGPTPIHPEPGGETSQRRWYWRVSRWERRSVRHSKKLKAKS